MAREMHYETKLENVRRTVITHTCDKCGRKLRPMQGLDGDHNELVIQLNPEECVSFFHFRDLCNECLESVWQAICDTLGVSADDLGNREDYC